MASTTASFKSIAVAVESLNFGNVNPLTGIPDQVNPLTYVTAAGIARADITTFGDMPNNTRDDEVRCNAYANPPEVATMWSGGSRVRRRTGEITLTFNEVQLLGDGSGAISTYAGHPLYMLINSGMKVFTPSATNDIVAAVTDNYNFDSSILAGVYQPGMGFAIEKNGRAEYSFVTDTDPVGVAGNISHSPSLQNALSPADVIRFGENFYTSPDLDLDALTSVSLRLDGVGFRTYAYGCRMSNLSVSVTNGRATMAITLQCAYITDDHSNYDVGCPSYPSGATQHLIGSYFITGDTRTELNGVAPYEIQGNNTQVSTDSVSFEISNTLVAEGRSDDLTLMSEWALADTQSSLTYTTTVPNSAIDDDFLDSALRTALLGFAPTGEGNGMAFYMPAGFQTTDGSKRDTSGDLVSQTLTLRAGPWNGAVDRSGAPDMHNSPVVLFFGL